MLFMAWVRAVTSLGKVKSNWNLFSNVCLKVNKLNKTSLFIKVNSSDRIKLIHNTKLQYKVCIWFHFLTHADYAWPL